MCPLGVRGIGALQVRAQRDVALGTVQRLRRRLYRQFSRLSKRTQILGQLEMFAAG